MVRKNIIVILLLFAFAFDINACQAKEHDYKGDTVEAKIAFFTQVLDLVQDEFVQEVSAGDLIDGALFGMLASLDKYSQFLTPQMRKELAIHRDGKFGGVGIRVRFCKDFLEILSLVKDSPAQKSGLSVGSRITAVDKIPISDLSREDILSSLRGKPGTEVNLTIKGKEDISALDVSVVRDTVVLESVVDVDIFDDKIGYVRISSFVADTDADFKKVLQDFDKKNIEGLILDLRGNPGGVLEDALNVLNCLVKPGQMLFEAKSQNPEYNFVFKSTDGGLLFEKELIVLIDKKSASGAEIIAGVVQDKKRGIVLGETSFGKGTMQQLFPLPGEAAVKLTVAKYFLAGGKGIEGAGITPDILLDEDIMLKDGDVCFKKALIVMQGVLHNKEKS